MRVVRAWRLTRRTLPPICEVVLVGANDRPHGWQSPLAFLSWRDRACVRAAASHLCDMVSWDGERAPQQPAPAPPDYVGYVDEFGEWPDDDPEDMMLLEWFRSEGMLGR